MLLFDINSFCRQTFYTVFWKKSPSDKLKKKYEALLKEAFELSSVNRKLADEKTAEAEEVLKELQKLNQSK